MRQGVVALGAMLMLMLMLMGCGDSSKPPEAPTTPASSSVVSVSQVDNPNSDPTTPPPDPTPRSPSAPSATATTTAAAAPVPTPTSVMPPTPGGPPFDRAAAAAALGGVNVQACKRAGGITGSGHVTVTFDPSGGVSAAAVDAGPFPGTSEGGCIAAQFRNAHVPPFAGAPVRVGKSFTVQ